MKGVKGVKGVKSEGLKDIRFAGSNRNPNNRIPPLSIIASTTPLVQPYVHCPLSPRSLVVQYAFCPFNTPCRVRCSTACS